MTNGKFITFEGPEGSGKSTHIQLLADFLRGFGVNVQVTREPGGTPTGEAIRTLLQHNGAGEAPTPRAEVLLFLASRAQLVEQFIQPALQNGAWVLCDRFEDSTFAYQGYGRGFDMTELRNVNGFATHGIKPDLTFLLDVSLATSKKRLLARQAITATAPDRIECEVDAFHLRLRAGFLELAKQEPERFVVLSTDSPSDQVAAMIREIVQKRFCGDAHAH